MEDRSVIYLTGLYGQMIMIRPRDIMRVSPHSVWTEVWIIGGTCEKVLESGEEVTKMIEACLKGEENDPVTEKPG